MKLLLESWRRYLKEGAVASKKDVHDLADKLSIPWDDDADFMDWTREVVGKSHLDKMTSEELEKVYKALEERGKEKFPYQIYCDMDGVLVDFDSATLKILNDLIVNPEEHQDNRRLYKAILKAKKEVGDKEITSDHINFGSPYKKVIDLMFRALATNKDSWAEMDWLEGGKELWDFIKPYKPIILTAPVEGSDASKLGKEEWCAKHLGEEVEVIVDADKEKYAGTNTILIDDREKNVNKFKDAGGKTILYINYDSAKQQMKQIINNGEQEANK